MQDEYTTVRITKKDHRILKVLSAETGLSMRVSLSLAIELLVDEYPELKKEETDGLHQ